ncbi:putative reverse transcriptase domain-containing protein [Tanacetum coccineum]
MASGNSVSDAEYTLSKLLQMDEAFSLARATEARFEDQRLSEGDHKDNMYKLVEVVGTTKVDVPYGNKSVDIMLEMHARECKMWAREMLYYRFDNNSRDNRGQQQQPFKRENVNGQNVASAYTVGNNVEREGYAGVLPYCSKCRMHHEGSCMAKYGHYRNECPKLRNQNRGNKTGNKTGNNEAKARAYAIGGGGADPDSNVVTGTFLLNNRHATILFDLGADRSFVLTTFSTLLDVIPSTLDTSYAVELADGRISETNVILRGCTLGLLGHPFDIDLMPIKLDSFNVIVGMDWSAKHHAVIVCDERIIRIPYGDEVLIIKGDGCNGVSNSKLSIISCTKIQKYIQKGCLVYLVQVTVKRSDDELEEKRLEDVPIV